MIDIFGIDLFGKAKKKREHEAAVIARHKLKSADRTIDGLMREIESIRAAAVASAKRIDSLEWELKVASNSLQEALERNQRLRNTRGLPALRKLDAEGKV